jgi:hypothetical protein
LFAKEKKDECFSVENYKQTASKIRDYISSIFEKKKKGL